MSKSYSYNFWNRIGRSSKVSSSNEPGRTVKSVQEFLNVDAELLDIGCGDGNISCQLGDFVKSVSVIDPSDAMINKARQQADARKLSNVKFVPGFLEDLPTGKQYDIVSAFSVLHHVHDLESFLGEINQRLRPGGLFIGVSACMGERRTAVVTLLKLGARVKLLPPMNFFSLLALRQSIVASGFELIAEKEVAKLPEILFVARKL